MIPRRFHRIWIGPAEMPDDHRAWIRDCAVLHPDWEQHLWDEDDLLPLIPSELMPVWQRANPVHKSDIGGYVLVYLVGGVYVDTDYRWYRPIDPWLYECETFCSLTDRGQISASVFGSAPKHAAWRAVLDALPAAFRADVQLSTSSQLLTRVLGPRADVRRLERSVFIPVPYGQRERLKTQTDYPASCAVHQFAASWIR